MNIKDNLEKNELIIYVILTFLLTWVFRSLLLIKFQTDFFVY